MNYCYQLYVPPTPGIGEFSSPLAVQSRAMVAKEALATYNRARQHAGLTELCRLPTGRKITFEGKYKKGVDIRVGDQINFWCFPQGVGAKVVEIKEYKGPYDFVTNILVLEGIGDDGKTKRMETSNCNSNWYECV